MIQFWRVLRGWWREQAREKGAASTTSLLVRNLWSFVRESMPEHRRQRYGDIEYDWENRVNTTSGTAGWRARLLGFRQGTNAADGLGVSVHEDRGSGVDRGTAPRGAAEHTRV